MSIFLNQVREWVAKANCRGSNPEDFFIGGRGGGTKGRNGNRIAIAIAMCNQCEVQPECLDYALHHEPYGVWGGMTESQRRLERRKRGISVETMSVNLPW